MNLKLTINLIIIYLTFIYHPVINKVSILNLIMIFTFQVAAAIFILLVNFNFIVTIIITNYYFRLTDFAFNCLHFYFFNRKFINIIRHRKF